MEREQGMADRAYEELKNLILSQKIKPGDHVPEVKLANQLGISRTPMREAIKRLASDGIVTMYPNRYAEITVFPPEWLQQVGIIRLALDTVAAHLSILYGSNYDFSVMAGYNEACHRAAKEGNMAERIKMNCMFHLELSRISKNEELYKMQEKLYMKLEFVQACNYDFVNPEKEQYRQHGEMIDALYARDEKRLVELLTAHDANFHRLDESPAFMNTMTSLFAPVPSGRTTEK